MDGDDDDSDTGAVAAPTAAAAVGDEEICSAHLPLSCCGVTVEPIDTRLPAVCSVE